MTETVAITVASVAESVGVAVGGGDTVTLSVAGTSETVGVVVQPGGDGVAVEVTEAVETVALAVASVAETVAVAIANQGDTVTIQVASGDGGDPTPAPETYETVSRNLRSYPATLAYSSGELASISYATPGGAVVKTFNRVAGRLASIVLSGALPAGIATTKTLGYTGDALTSVGYA
jgi:hypothetical protein